MSSQKVLNSVAYARGQWVYHIEWAPKYRYKMFRSETLRNKMTEILQQVASEKNIKLLELSVMPDHIHVVAEIPPSMSLAQASQIMKGKSSYLFFREYPNMRLRYPRGHFWSPGKFYRTVGDVDIDRMREYVRYQNDALQTHLISFSQGTPAL